MVNVEVVSCALMCYAAGASLATKGETYSFVFKCAFFLAALSSVLRLMARLAA